MEKDVGEVSSCQDHGRIGGRPLLPVVLRLPSLYLLPSTILSSPVNHLLGPGLKCMSALVVVLRPQLNVYIEFSISQSLYSRGP